MMMLGFFSLGRPVASQTVGDCPYGEAVTFLDVNNVRAYIGTRGDFFRSWPIAYEVPKGGGVNSYERMGLFVGGKDETGIRVSASAHGTPGFWPGPLDEFGNPPEDCSVFDRMYNVYRSDIDDFERGAGATADIIEWPYHLGAPVVDGAGVLGNYDLEAGDRPEITGDQGIWWILNDAGNVKWRPEGDPIGLEVRMLA